LGKNHDKKKKGGKKGGESWVEKDGTTPWGWLLLRHYVGIGQQRPNLGHTTSEEEASCQRVRMSAEHRTPWGRTCPFLDKVENGGPRRSKTFTKTVRRLMSKDTEGEKNGPIQSDHSQCMKEGPLSHRKMNSSTGKKRPQRRRARANTSMALTYSPTTRGKRRTAIFRHTEFLSRGEEKLVTRGEEEMAVTRTKKDPIQERSGQIAAGLPHSSRCQKKRKGVEGGGEREPKEADRAIL